MDDAQIREIVRNVLRGAKGESPASGGHEVLIEASARHAHLTQEALETLFGPGAVLGVKKELSQPGEYLSDKRVKLITPKGELANVAILGPVREAVQVELSATDCRGLGLKAPVNLSGDLTNAADVVMLGDAGLIEARSSVIIAKAHVHLTKADAAAFGVKDGEHVRVRVESLRPITLDDVIVRVRDTFSAAIHVDFDEANACGGTCSAKAYLIGGSSVCVPCMGEEKACATLSWSEMLINEKVARQLAVGHERGSVRFMAGAIITPAARDIFSSARISVEFI